MSTIDFRLAKKGRTEPRLGLAQQGKVHTGLAVKYLTELARFGWSAAKTTSLSSGVVVLESSISAQAEARGEARGASRAERIAVTKAKKFVRQLRNALPMVLRDTPIQGVSAESFEAGDALKRSTPKISGYLTKIRPSVVLLDEVLKDYFEGPKASEMLDALKIELDEADMKQEVDLAGLPLETLAVYEAKGACVGDDRGP